MKNANIKKWRVNYVVTYHSSHLADIYRTPILDTLKHIAFLRKIECKIKLEYSFADGEGLSRQELLKDTIDDLVYFRSTSQTEISCKEFRQLIDHIFDNYQLGIVEVGSQLLYSLPKYPFPKD